MRSLENDIDNKCITLIEMQEPKVCILNEEQVIIESTALEGTHFLSPVSVEKKKDRKQLLRTFITCTASIFLAFMSGYSYNSFNLVKDISLNKESKDFLPEYHDTLRNLPPVFFFIGSGISTIFFTFRESYDMKMFLYGCTIVLALIYLLEACYFHILSVFFVRLITGLVVGPIMIFVPQILHTIASEHRKGIASSLYTFGYLLGITCPLLIIPLVDSDYFLIVKCLPIVLSLFCLILLYFSVDLGRKQKKENPMSIFSFMFESATIKSFFAILALQFCQKISGAQFVALFSTEFFTGDDKYINSVTPLLIAICFNFIGGMTPDYLGRKLPVVAGLAGISLIMFVIYFSDVSLWLIISFIFLYNSGLSVVPFIYQQEIVKPDCKNVANEIGTMFYSIFSVLMVICIAFVYTKSSKIIYLIFAVGSLIGAILLSFILIETLKKPSPDFIKDWINYSSWLKHKIK